MHAVPVPALTETKDLLAISYKAIVPCPIASISLILVIGISLKLLSKSLDLPPVTPIFITFSISTPIVSSIESINCLLHGFDGNEKNLFLLFCQPHHHNYKAN